MLRQASKLLLNRAVAPALPRAFTTSALRCSEDLHANEIFTKKWEEVNPSHLAPPVYGKEYLAPSPPAPEVGAPLPDKLSFSFYMPHSIEMQSEEVDMVLVPATSGDFGVLPGHVPTVAQLKPGVMSVHKDGDKDIKKYFVSSGFAFVHNNSTAEVCAVEAVPVEQLDPDAVKASLDEYTALLASASDDYTKAQAQIGIEVCSAMNAALA